MMNLLLLIFDDLRADFGMAGVPDRVIPNIRRLQARGMDFSAAHTPCAICSPGRACLFTGLSPDTHGVTTLQDKLRGRLPDVITWPQALRSRGWYTMRSGKVYHKGIPDAICGRGDGDDDPYSWSERHNPGGYELNANGEMRNYTPWETHRAGIGGAIAWLRAEKGDALHHDWQVGTDVCRAIRQHEGDQPAFWAAGFARPHVPLVAPKRFFEALDDLDISLPEEAAQATPLPGHVRGQWCGDFGLSPEQRREAIRAYLACVMFADEQVGRILDQLEASGMAEQTIVLLTADHGFQLGEHGLWFKNFLYRESTHIPLVIADPRRPHTHGRRCHALVGQTDLFPTVFDLLTIDPPAQPAQGASLLPLLENPDAPWRSVLQAQVDWGPVLGRSVRSRDYRYVEWRGVNGCARELYDLTADPGEAINLLHGGASSEHASALAPLVKWPAPA